MSGSAPSAQAPRGAALRFESVSKRYRARAILRDVSFEVADGVSTAIAGINGAGKSTLLRCLLDFIRPDSGHIFIQGHEHRDTAARAALGWLPERFVPPAHLSARECLDWLAGLRGAVLDHGAMRDMAEELGLGTDPLEVRVRELSKGMTQKLGLMSIGLSACPIWVLDEPMSGLDPQARRSVTRLIDGARRSGRTVLFTSHGLRDLPSLCDQLIVLHEGIVRYAGTPQGFGTRYGSADLETAFLACIEAPDAGHGDGAMHGGAEPPRGRA